MPQYTATYVQPLLDDPLLGECAYTGLARLLPYLREQQVEAGEFLFKRNDDAAHAYLILDGEVRCTYARGSETRLKSGLCGEEAGGEISRYQADAAALTPLRVLAIPRERLLRLIRSHPQLGGRLRQLLLARLQGEEWRPSTAQMEGQERDGSWREVLGWLCTLALPALIVAFDLGLPAKGVPFAAIFAAAASMWVFRLADDYVPALFAMFAVLVFGLAPPAIVLAGFASDGFFLALSILGLGTVISVSGLSYRFLLWMLSKLPATPFWQDFGLLITGVLLTPLVPSSNGRVALVAPLMTDMQDLLHYSSKGKAATRLAATAFAGATSLSAVFLTSKSVNFVVFGLLSSQEQNRFQWLYWLQACLVLGGVILVMHLLIGAWFFRSSERPRVSRVQLDAQRKLLGPLKLREWAAFAGIGVFVLGVATASLHRIQPPWLALAILYVLLLFGFLRKNEFREQIDWPFLVYQGSLVGLTSGFNGAGLDRWLAERLGSLGNMMQNEFGLFIAVLFVVLAAIRLVVPINAAVVIVATVFMPLAEIQGVNPWAVGVTILVLGEMWFLPHQCSYYLQWSDAAGERFDERSLLGYNALQNLAKLAALYLSLPYWHWLGLL